MHSPAAQLKLKELEGKNTYEEINPKEDENARLKAEVERLEKEVWRMKVFKGIDEDTKATLKDALNTVPEWAKVLETEAENARLKAEVERLTAFTTRTIIPNEELQAQVERLTKAGDAMAKEWVDRESLYHGNEDFISDWNAAKEGKPHA
jgi:hypothetical protein